MLEEDTKRATIIRTALRLAQEKGWRQLTLAEIAQAANVSLVDVSQEFASKAAILEAFSREVDQEVLRRAAPGREDTARDRLFDVIMTRFEVLAPYKDALKRIAEDLRASPLLAAGMCRSAAKSHYWMLTAAGVNAEGREACLRIPGLMAVTAGVMPIWFEDDDPGLARTMAALDRRLRRGERTLDRVEGVCGRVESLLCAFLPRRRGRPERQASAPPEPPTPEPSPSPEPPRAV